MNHLDRLYRARLDDPSTESFWDEVLWCWFVWPDESGRW